MKIGIVTYVRTATCNYGAELQCFALQYILNKNGYDTEVLNLHRVLPSNSRFTQTVKKAIKTRLKHMNIFRASISIAALVLSVCKDKYYNKKNHSIFLRKKEIFDDFFFNYIKHSEKEYYPNDLDTANLSYDTYIAGSDQIWNYNNSDRVDVFFLMFANRFKAKKISYAASFSVSSIPEEYKKKYKQWINNIDFLSVRESEGISIIKEITGKQAKLVCDPTLLLDKEAWKNIFKDIQLPIKQEKYLLIYTMSRSNKVYQIAKEIAQRLGNIKIYSIKMNLHPNANKDINELQFISPQQWVGLIMNAAYVVTDSFHGTAFSINFNKPFTVVQNPMSNLNSRVNTILSFLNLKDRIILNNTIKLPEFNLNIDYSKINQTVNAWREDSFIFLTNAINSKKIK
ncbi:polysaccharide pyruvyl transferase family protein [Phocaeicola barnesiae]|uniref:polysaccharide pyruvyl transferase family protein n=1 Tax=Phocaeicola barnesiae TaxID=376804 RepID=UPI0025A3A389|nr:polysaccharide pyruvyl transferase family protein [Phocaeicola barnesiae]MDM8240786.1 polysaccharide pyruvyl transferase family protein [Phocaeicola barnesiae]